ncbi:hypothetical protein BaRGS_00017002 [Batillaria attramentaria]|uniref:Uncharacterized protein n=1 Tax=Batillaria attramentaria TaxID=370345 RepID=A0ABD0KXE7_9CAEN
MNVKEGNILMHPEEFKKSSIGSGDVSNHPQGSPRLDRGVPCSARVARAISSRAVRRASRERLGWQRASEGGQGEGKRTRLVL